MSEIIHFNCLLGKEGNHYRYLTLQAVSGRNWFGISWFTTDGGGGMLRVERKGYGHYRKDFL